MTDGTGLTDDEWRAFQAIPDQGYSHRAWIDARLAERREARAEARETEVADVLMKHWTCGSEFVGEQTIRYSCGIEIGPPRYGLADYQRAHLAAALTGGAEGGA